jgi:hypothetical protein
VFVIIQLLPNYSVFYTQETEDAIRSRVANLYLGLEDGWGVECEYPTLDPEKDYDIDAEQDELEKMMMVEAEGGVYQEESVISSEFSGDGGGGGGGGGEDGAVENRPLLAMRSMNPSPLAETPLQLQILLYSRADVHSGKSHAAGAHAEQQTTPEAYGGSASTSNDDTRVKAALHMRHRQQIGVCFEALAARLIWYATATASRIAIATTM